MGSLGLQQAQNYLVGRARTRAPLGAVEYLRMRHFERTQAEKGDSFEERNEIAASVCEIYQQLFPREYRMSQVPIFSASREQELYALIDQRMFELPEMPADGEYFLPGIPIQAAQQHDWLNECCPFASLQTCFKLALVLSGRKAGEWRRLGLDRPPAPPVGAIGWTLFRYACLAEGPPIDVFPRIFDLVCYRTGNVWLDAPRGAAFYLDWGVVTLARLLVARREAQQLYLDALLFNRWLDADPANVRRAVEIWNEAAEDEKAAGYEGLMIEDLMVRRGGR